MGLPAHQNLNFRQLCLVYDKPPLEFLRENPGSSLRLSYQIYMPGLESEDRELLGSGTRLVGSNIYSQIDPFNCPEGVLQVVVAWSIDHFRLGHYGFYNKEGTIADGNESCSLEGRKFTLHLPRIAE